MCRLLGIAANKPVDLMFSLLEGTSSLATMSQANRDGWGLGWYEGAKPVVVKEARQAHGSEQFTQTSAEGYSRIFIAHVRWATRGNVSQENCHPFNYKQWLFAHNGTVDRDWLFNQLEERHRSAIEGETDSEVLFHWLIQNIERGDSVLDGLGTALQNIHHYTHYTSVNFLLTDGSLLYAFREAQERPDDYSLYYLLRDPQTSGPDQWHSDEVRALLHSKGLRGERAVLICSEKLTEETWEEIPMGHLLVVDEKLTLQRVPMRRP